MRHIKILLLLFSTVLGISGCLKKDDSNTDPYNLSAPVYTLEWIQPGGTTVNSGLQYFANGALTYPATDDADTANFSVRLTGGSYADKDITVTIGQDTKALLDNYKSDSITYEAMPDSLYKLLNTTAVIKKGTGVAYFQVVFYPSKINATKNYMFAPTVISPTDHQTSSNFGHIYFHTIGNLFAGSYKVTGTRYNYTGTVSWDNKLPVPPGYTATTDMGLYSPRTAAPDNGKTFEIAFGNIGSDYRYIITYDPVAQTISVDYTFDNLYSNIVTTVVSLTPPTDNTKASFHIITHYNNALAGAGNDRIFDETFVQQ